MMELVDVADSKSAASDGVPVRLRLPAPRRRTLRTAQKNQSLAAAGFSSAVLRGASFSPRDPLCWARVGPLFIRGLAVFLWKSEAISAASAVASLTSGTPLPGFLKSRKPCPAWADGFSEVPEVIFRIGRRTSLSLHRGECPGWPGRSSPWSCS